jgi:SAM-dependent methyltransferase
VTTVPLSPRATLRWQATNALLNDLNPARILEIGCGGGAFGARFAQRATYVGVEPDEASYRTARNRVAPLGGDVRLGTVDLIGPGEFFDVICAFEVIEHLQDDVQAVRDWTQHLNPGGAVLVSVPAWPDRYGAWDALVGHYRRYTPNQLSATLRAAGCDDIKVVGYGWPLDNALEAVRNKIGERRQAAARSDSMDERTAGSGRLLQPNQVGGLMVRAGVTPFAALQRLRPNWGTGLVGYGRIPS